MYKTIPIFLLCLILAADAAVASGTVLPAEIRAWQTLEIAPDIPVATDNPFDPHNEYVKAVFTNGSESYSVNGFATRNFKREVIYGIEKLTPDGPLRWLIRFTPPREGDWQAVISYNRFDRQLHDFPEENISFKVLEAAGDKRGFIRAAKEDSRYMAYDDGSPFFAVGENLAWADARGTAAYDIWLDRLASAHVNYVRIWMATWGFSIEWTDPANPSKQGALGDYSGRLDRAWQLDYVISGLEKRGIKAMLCLLNHGQFSTKVNPEWGANPYNAANGGPLSSPGEFFTDQRAMELFDRRITYIISRWGASPAIMSWELWNEVNFTDMPVPEAVAQWHERFAKRIKELDPYRRPVTTSIAESGLRGKELMELIYPLPDIDFTQAHIYSDAPVMTHDFENEFQRLFKDARKYSKPLLISEAGVSWRGPSETIKTDPNKTGFHDILWSGIFSETFGTGMTWWWDNYVDPENMYPQFSSVAQFVDGVKFHMERFESAEPVATAEGHKIEAFSLNGDTTVLAWIRDQKNKWHNRKYKPKNISSGSLTLEGLRSKKYSAVWLDAWSGKEIQRSEVSADGGKAVISIPDFRLDIALKMVAE